MVRLKKTKLSNIQEMMNNYMWGGKINEQGINLDNEVWNPSINIGG